MPLGLYQFLCRWYGRVGSDNLQCLYALRIDDQSSRDIGERFCRILVKVKDDARFELRMEENVPSSRSIGRLVESRGGVIRKGSRRSELQVELSVADTEFIEQLADQIEGLVASGKRYRDRNWKWRCPRIAASLHQFAARLAEYSEMKAP